MTIDTERMVITQIDADGTVTILGVRILLEGDVAWVAARPGTAATSGEAGSAKGNDPNESDRGRKHFYWCRAKRMNNSRLLEAASGSDFPRILMTPEELPPLWRLTEPHLQGELSLPLGFNFPVKRLKQWADKRDFTFQKIESLVAGRTLSQLLQDEEMDAKVTAHCLAGGWTKSACWSYLNRFIFAGAHKRGLLPFVWLCGAPGKPKFFAIPTGRPTLASSLGETADKAMPMTERDRLNCRLGWDRFMKDGVTLEEAFDNFSAMFYASSRTYLGPTDVKVDLLPPKQRPTINQFKRHGEAGDPRRASWLLGLSKKSLKNDVAGYRGTASTGIRNALQVGVIDSTSDDVTLCSEASTLLMLSVPRTTRILDVASTYLLGEYTSFEPVSARTHIAAILQAASDKVNWARQYGIDLEPGDWHHGTFASIRGDNGEGKSHEAMGALTGAHVDMEFTRSYLARAKNICELNHLLIHKLVDWRTPGSTMGKMRSRGEKLDTDSCFTFSTFMAHRVKAIMYYNNVADVSNLLTVEMRRRGVPATRKAIFEYMIETGQVASGPADLHSMKPYSLPQINAQIRQSGIHLWDPRDGGNKRLIPDLVYWSEWLFKSGLLTMASRTPKSISVAIDPAFVGSIFVLDANQGGMWHQVDLQTSDEDKKRLTLVDWLCISDHDSVKRFLLGPTRQEYRVNVDASIAHSAEQSKRLRKSERAAASKKRNNTSDELARQNAARLGLPISDSSGSRSVPSQTEAAANNTSNARLSSGSLRSEQGNESDFMTNLRARRASGGRQ